ncbi:MAG: transposase [Verrucomicrobiaceae bacterium]|nr:transposase [Verrucomicrobiaceae bacterium]
MRDPHLAQIVADRLHHFDGQRYDLWGDVIMPNQVHALFPLRDGQSLPDTLQGWKGVSSRLIHPTGLSALNPLWQPDDFDRLIRSPEPFCTVKACLAANNAVVGRPHRSLLPRPVLRQG